MTAGLFSRAFFMFLIVLSIIVPASSPGICQGQNQSESRDMEKTAQKNQGSLKNPLKGQPSGPANKGLIQPIVNDKGRIMVYIRMTYISQENLDELTALGVEITHVADRYNTVTAFINPDQISSIESLETVLNVRRAAKPITNIQSGPPDMSGPDKPLK
jgi:hypothetical protein